MWFLLFALSLLAEEPAWVADAVVEKAKQAIVIVAPSENSVVSGFFVSEDGLVITQAGALEGHQSVTIYNQAKEKISGCKLLFVDAEHDLAVFATAHRAPVYLPIRDKAVQPFEPCVALHHSGAYAIKATDGAVLARRRAPDWTEARFQDFLVLALHPGAMATTGGALITADGAVAGMCDFVNGSWPNKRTFAVPGEALKNILARARTATKPAVFPRPGEVLGHQFPACPEYQEGLKLVGLGDFPAAKGRLEAALKVFPGNAIVVNHLAQVHVELGDTASADRLLREAVKAAPRKMYLDYQLGTILQASGEQAKALTHFQQLTVKFPEFALPWFGLVRQFSALERKSEALAAAQRYAELEPDSLTAWRTCATLLAASGDQAGARVAEEKFATLESYLFRIRYKAPQRK